MEKDGGSLTILGRSKLDAWGSPGDALPLMRAVKEQLDPKGTLNPGRFVGGI
jgi:glycolate oxidase FAD binding subunit